MAGIAISDPFCVERHRDDFSFALIENEFGLCHRQTKARTRALWGNRTIPKSLWPKRRDLPAGGLHPLGDRVTLMAGEERVDCAVEKGQCQSMPPARASQFRGQLFPVRLATGRGPRDMPGKMGKHLRGEVISHMARAANLDDGPGFKEQGAG